MFWLWSLSTHKIHWYGFIILHVVSLNHRGILKSSCSHWFACCLLH